MMSHDTDVLCTHPFAPDVTKAEKHTETQCSNCADVKGKAVAWNYMFCSELLALSPGFQSSQHTQDI